MSPKPNPDINPRDEVLFAQGVLRAEADALIRSAERMNEVIVKALDLLDTAERIIVIGVGKSGHIARKIAATLSSVGHPAEFLHPTEAMHGDLGNVSAGSVCILLSKSGTSSELVSLLPTLQQRSLPTIGIVGRLDSFLARSVDLCLDASVEKEACPYDLVPSSSTTLALAIGDALALGLMRRRGFGPQDFARHHPFGQLGRNLNLRVRDVMHSSQDALPLCSPQQSFREALIVSTSKAMGCVCVVDAEQHLLGIITDGDVRRALQKVDDIRGLVAADLMSPNPLVSHPHMLLQEALRIMEEGQRQISVLPVVNDNQCCIGVLRLHDILQVQN